jgi:hypothetical protein
MGALLGQLRLCLALACVALLLLHRPAAAVQPKDAAVIGALTGGFVAARGGDFQDVMLWGGLAGFALAVQVYSPDRQQREKQHSHAAALLASTAAGAALGGSVGRLYFTATKRGMGVTLTTKF